MLHCSRNESSFEKNRGYMQYLQIVARFYRQFCRMNWWELRYYEDREFDVTYFPVELRIFRIEDRYDSVK